jgi:Holliday junction resolvasome RuvABC endonuclease subunit
LSDPFRVIGIDPAFRRTGWALLERSHGGSTSLVQHGTIVAPRESERAHALLSIQLALVEVMTTWEPDQAVFELPGRWMHRIGSSRASIETMAMSRGVMLAACCSVGVSVQEADFHTVRTALLGRANARTEEVVAYVVSRFVLPRRPRGQLDTDVANAILMAVYGLSMAQLLEPTPNHNRYGADGD